MTYARDVAPILNERCVSCHHPGEVAPFSLVGYENAKKWSDMIAKVAARRLMPPWKAQHGYGDIIEQGWLSTDEISKLSAWRDSGSPEGDKAAEPALPEFKSDWRLGPPDIILQMAKPFKVAAEGADVYRNFVLHVPADGSLWVKAMDVRPGNRRIVHHVVAYIDTRHAGARLAALNQDDQDGYTSSGGGVGFLPSGALGGWAPGFDMIPTPAGTAFKLPSGADLILQVHYHKSGKEEEDLTRVGLYLAKEPIDKEMRLALILNFGIDIPPGEKDYEASQVYTVPADASFFGMTPHMHLLGKAMKAHAELPDGTNIPLIDVEDWDFNWQLTYKFRHPVHLPSSSKIVIEARYDNSADNPRNPTTPPKRVRWGEQSTDEMFFMIASYTLDSESLLSKSGAGTRVPK